jgi:predicted MFS family arabinose efflux permease
VDPLLLRGAFRIGFLILAAALLVLPFEDRSSPEFVATVLSVVIGFVFVAIVTVLARSSLPPRPRSAPRNSVDKLNVKSYNDPDPHQGGKR